MNVVTRINPDGSVTYKRVLVPTEYQKWPGRKQQRKKKESEKVICDICGHTFGGQSALLPHRRVCGKTRQEIDEMIKVQKEKRIEQNYCVHCDKTFEMRKEYREHLVRLLETEQPCPVKCDKIFRKEDFSNEMMHKRMFIMHIKDCLTKDIGDFKKVCIHCKESFATADLLRDHLDQLLESAQPCPLKCGKAFEKTADGTKTERRRTFVQHVLQCGNPKPKDDKRKCSKCGKDFDRAKHASRMAFLNVYKRHEKSCKGPKGSRVCPRCNKDLKYPAALKAHLASRIVCEPAGLEITCDDCHRIFRSPRGRTLHRCEGKPPGDESLSCDLCQRVFNSMNGKMQHLCENSFWRKRGKKRWKVNPKEEEVEVEHLKMEVEEEEDGMKSPKIELEDPEWFEGDEGEDPEGMEEDGEVEDLDGDEETGDQEGDEWVNNTEAVEGDGDNESLDQESVDPLAAE